MSAYPLSSPKVSPSLPSTSEHVPLFPTITHPTTPAFEFTHDTYRLSLRSRSMSRSTEQLSVFHPPPQRQLLTQSVHTLPRSVSVADLHLNERPQRFERHRLGLRRVPPSINDLRLLAQKQNSAILIQDQFKIQLAYVTTSGSQLSHIGDAKVGHPEGIEKHRRRRRYKSYQDMHILSMYQEDLSLASLSSERTSRKNSIQCESTAYHTSDSESSQDSSPRPKNPSDRSLGENTANIKDTMSEHEKVRRVNARRVQVVEHSQRQESCHAETDEEIVSVSTCLIERS